MSMSKRLKKEFKIIGYVKDKNQIRDLK
jgi:hypothetical protein